MILLIRGIQIDAFPKKELNDHFASLATPVESPISIFSQREGAVRYVISGQVSERK